ncbi:MAG: 6-bladed beta-propeller [Phycisphaerae bacterium]
MKRWAGYLVVLMGLTAGCSTQRVELLVAPEPPLVWPVPPDSARVRYVGQLTGSADTDTRTPSAKFWQELLHGPTAPSMMITPYAVAVGPQGRRVAVADTNGRCVHLFDVANPSYQRLEMADRSGKRLECPVGVAWVGQELWVADSELHAVVASVGVGGGRLLGQDVLKRPSGLTYCPSNQLCYVADADAHAIYAFDRRGEMVFQFGSKGAGPGQFNRPTHLTCDQDALLVADSMNFRVQRLALDGSPLAMVGRIGDAAGDLSLPKGVALDASGNQWIVDAHYENVQAFDAQGRLLMALGREGQDPGEFWLPAGACIDVKQRLWVADTYNRRVQVFELLP